MSSISDLSSHVPLMQLIQTILDKPLFHSETERQTRLEQFTKQISFMTKDLRLPPLQPTSFEDATQALVSQMTALSDPQTSPVSILSSSPVYDVITETNQYATQALSSISSNVVSSLLQPKQAQAIPPQQPIFPSLTTPYDTLSLQSHPLQSQTPLPSYSRTPSPMVSDQNGNVWIITSSYLIGINITSLIESSQTGVIQAIKVGLRDKRQDMLEEELSMLSIHTNTNYTDNNSIQSSSSSYNGIDLVSYDSIVINSSSTYAIIYQSSPLPYTQYDTTTTPTTPIPLCDPIVVKLPQLQTIDISTLQLSNTTTTTIINNDNISIPRVSVPAIYLYINPMQQQQKHKHKHQNASIRDIQFHALSPTCVIVLTSTSLSLYTITNNMVNMEISPDVYSSSSSDHTDEYTMNTTQLYGTPTPLSNMLQSSSPISSSSSSSKLPFTLYPTVYYNLSTLPYSYLDPALEHQHTYNNTNDMQQYDTRPDKQEWIKLLYLPSFPDYNNTLYQSLLLPSSSSNYKDSDTTTPTTPTQRQQHPPILSFTYLLLSSNGIIASLSPIIPHLGVVPTSSILSLRSLLANIIFQDNNPINNNTKDVSSSSSSSLPSHLTYQSLHSTHGLSRHLASLLYIDLIFGLTPTLDINDAKHSLNNNNIDLSLTLDSQYPIEHIHESLLIPDILSLTSSHTLFIPVLQICGIHTSYHTNNNSTFIDMISTFSSSSSSSLLSSPFSNNGSNSSTSILNNNTAITNTNTTLPIVTTLSVSKSINTYTDNDNTNILDDNKSPSSSSSSSSLALLQTQQHTFIAPVSTFPTIYAPQHYFAGIHTYKDYIDRFSPLLHSSRQHDIAPGTRHASSLYRLQRLTSPVLLSPPILLSSTGQRPIYAHVSNIQSALSPDSDEQRTKPISYRRSQHNSYTGHAHLYTALPDHPYLSHCTTSTVTHYIDPILVSRQHLQLHVYQALLGALLTIYPTLFSSTNQQHKSRQQQQQPQQHGAYSFSFCGNNQDKATIASRQLEKASQNNQNVSSSSQSLPSSSSSSSPQDRDDISDFIIAVDSLIKNRCPHNLYTLFTQLRAPLTAYMSYIRNIQLHSAHFMLSLTPITQTFTNSILYDACYNAFFTPPPSPESILPTLIPQQQQQQQPYSNNTSSSSQIARYLGSPLCIPLPSMILTLTRNTHSLSSYVTPLSFHHFIKSKQGAILRSLSSNSPGIHLFLSSLATLLARQQSLSSSLPCQYIIHNMKITSIALYTYLAQYNLLPSSSITNSSSSSSSNSNSSSNISQFTLQSYLSFLSRLNKQQSLTYVSLVDSTSLIILPQSPIHLSLAHINILLHNDHNNNTSILIPSTLLRSPAVSIIPVTVSLNGSIYTTQQQQQQDHSEQIDYNNKTNHYPVVQSTTPHDEDDDEFVIVNDDNDGESYDQNNDGYETIDNGPFDLAYSIIGTDNQFPDMVSPHSKHQQLDNGVISTVLSHNNNNNSDNNPTHKHLPIKHQYTLLFSTLGLSTSLPSLKGRQHNMSLSTIPLIGQVIASVLKVLSTTLTLSRHGKKSSSSSSPSSMLPSLYSDSDCQDSILNQSYHANKEMLLKRYNMTITLYKRQLEKQIPELGDKQQQNKKRQLPNHDNNTTSNNNNNKEPLSLSTFIQRYTASSSPLTLLHHTISSLISSSSSPSVLTLSDLSTLTEIHARMEAIMLDIGPLPSQIEYMIKQLSSITHTHMSYLNYLVHLTAEIQSHLELLINEMSQQHELQLLLSQKLTRIKEALHSLYSKYNKTPPGNTTTNTNDINNTKPLYDHIQRITALQTVSQQLEQQLKILIENKIHMLSNNTTSITDNISVNSPKYNVIKNTNAQVSSIIGALSHRVHEITDIHGTLLSLSAKINALENEYTPTTAL